MPLRRGFDGTKPPIAKEITPDDKRVMLVYCGCVVVGVEII
jgi:hypothetical protein